MILILSVTSAGLKGQIAYEHIRNEAIYDYLDQLYSQHIIEVNTAIKPYSREQIADWLLKADEKRAELSKAQQAELDIYLSEYSLERGASKEGRFELLADDNPMRLHFLPPELTWNKGMYRALFRPVYGIRFINSTNANFFHSYGLGEMVSYFGDNLSFYASFRDHHQSEEALALPGYLTQERGGAYKLNVQDQGGADYSEMRGGITFKWSWGDIGLVKEHLMWGDAYNGTNILSGRTPSFPMIKFHMKPTDWFEFNYFHGWLVSEVIDSSRSYFTPNGDFRSVFREKYMAANMYTFRPWPNLYLSLGNSIIYSDIGFHPAYLIPFSFFKSIDHTLNKGIDNQNSQVFFNVSSRQIKYLNLFASFYIDELSVFRITDPDRNNFYSAKAGFSLRGWPLKDLTLTSEFTHTNPLTFKHRLPATTFEMNRINLGHYLIDNAQELYIGLRYNLIGASNLQVQYSQARKGNDYQYNFNGPYAIDEFPILQDETWTRELLRFRLNYYPFPNMRCFAEYQYSNVQAYDVDGVSAEDYLERFGPEYLHGETNTFIIGIGIGY